MSAVIYHHPEQLPANLLQSCRIMPYPPAVLMCPPDSFDVVDVKNPFMAGQIGKVNKDRASLQWDTVRQAFLKAGTSVELIEPVPGCEDMVFCANQTFVGLDAAGQKLCLLSQMKYPSRQREVAAFADWFAARGYRVEQLPAGIGFEGSGDAIWHPGRALVWGGSGFRTQVEAYQFVSNLFTVPVIHLPLKSNRFYHLDTCFCAIDEATALIYPESLTDDGIAMIRRLFKNVIECSEDEANAGMACNAASIGGRLVVIQEGCTQVAARLRGHGYKVLEVDTSEYLRSGGSVFCMKNQIF